MAGLSKITLVGTLLNEPRSSQTNSGIALTRFVVEVEREVRGQGLSQSQGAPDFVTEKFSVAVFGQTGAALSQRFASGDMRLGTRLLVMGRFEYRERQDQFGDQLPMEVTADEVHDLGPDTDGSSRPSAGGSTPCRMVVVGNLGRDPEDRQTSSGARVVNFSVAVSRPVSRQAPQGEENTNWFRIAGWDNVADRMTKLRDMGALVKGQKVLVEGQFSTRQWTDNAGQQRTDLEVRARDFELLGGRDQSASSGGYGQGDTSRGSYGGGGGRQGGGGRDGGYGNEGNSSGRGGRRDEDFSPQDVDDIPF
ncbi:MAG: single-stranded DNA-binding protein [Chloroflexota bacterium]